MRRVIFLMFLIFPVAAFGQSYEGSYRAAFFNLFSEPRMIVAEFEIRADNSLSGKIKLDETVKTFSGNVEKNGKFEAVIEQAGNFTYKLKGKFDKNNKISLVQRNQSGAGFNKSVSENALEGNFSRIRIDQIASVSQPLPKTELVDNGKSRLKITHSNPLFGTDWIDFSASVAFGNSAVTPVGSEAKKVTGAADVSDYFVVNVKSKIEGQQTLRINAPIYSTDKKVWRQNELRTISYREVIGEQRNSFLAGSSAMQGEARYADGSLEIINETDTQIVFKLLNFKIKKLAKDEYVTVSGFIYADK